MLVEWMEWTHVHSVGPQSHPSSQVNCLYQLYDDWTFRGQLGTRLSSGCWFLLHGLAQDSSIYESPVCFLLQVPEEAHSSRHIMHSCRKVWALLPQGQIVRVMCAFLLPWEESFPCQDSSTLKTLIWPSIAWIEMKWWKYKKEDFITLSFRLCNLLSPSCLTAAFWIELY